MGNINAKTKIVHFYVQRNTSFTTTNAAISFELSRLNVGGAMNLTSGIFIAPVPGIYYFHFSGLKCNTVTLLVISLQVNGVSVGRSLTSQPSSGTFDAISLTASFHLNANDRVNLYNDVGVLVDDNLYFTSFTGWLVEEDFKKIS